MSKIGILVESIGKSLDEAAKILRNNDYYNYADQFYNLKLTTEIMAGLINPDNGNVIEGLEDEFAQQRELP